MRCETCGIDTGMHALSNKPDPGWGYNMHTWEQCARQLLAEVYRGDDMPPSMRGAGNLRERIARLIAKTDKRWEAVREAIRSLENAAK